MNKDINEDILFERPFAEVLAELEANLAEVDDSKAYQLASKAIGASDSDNLDEKYLLFSVGEHVVAIALTAVAEVAEMPPITRVPNVPSWIRGVVSVHNEILSVVDIGTYMQWESNRPAAASRMVLIKQDEMKFVTDTDRILGTHTLQISETDSADSSPPAFDPRYFRKGKTNQGIECMVLDHLSLLSEERFLQLRM